MLASRAVANGRVFATHLYNPAGAGGDEHPYNLGVFYDDPYWAIFNENGFLMGSDLGFNIAGGLSTTDNYIHVANLANTALNTTVLNHPDVNDNPRAWILASHNWSPILAPTAADPHDGAAMVAGGHGVYFDATYGVWYNSRTGRWAIFDQAGKAGSIPESVAFNVLVEPHPSIFIDGFESGDTSIWSDSTAP